MRRNTVTYWTTADFANRETCSFIRLNVAFRKTLLQAAKKKSRKLIDHGKQLLPTPRFQMPLCFMTRRVLWEMIGRDRSGGGEHVNSILSTCFLIYCSLLRDFVLKISF